MPRLSAQAPDLAVSPDGGWAADLTTNRLRLYDLGRDRYRASDSASPQRISPITEIERLPHPGRVVFLSEDRLLHLWLVSGPGEDGDYLAAELLTVPTLSETGRGLRVPGCQRIVGVGPGGAVVTPLGSGADIISLRGSELTVHRTFMRSEVLSAVAAPERRFLLEQRSGFELWDPQARKALTRLVLNTRQAMLQLGYASSGRLLWAVTGSIPVHVEVFRASDGRKLFELDQPGRALQADAGPGRLLIAVEERETLSFLDLDLSGRSLRRVTLPASEPPPVSFVVSPAQDAPELLVRLDSEHEPLLRLPLHPVAVQRASHSDERNTTPGSPTSTLAKPTPRSTASKARPDLSARALRETRPENRLIRRTGPAAELSRDADLDSEFDEEAHPGQSRGAGFATERSLHAQATLSPTEDEDGPLDLMPADDGPAVVSLALGSGSRNQDAPPTTSRWREMLGRSFDARRSPAAWQWELGRWAAMLLDGPEQSVAPLPPDGGPLQAIAQRLRLSSVGHKVLGLLYAAQALLGLRPRGMRPLEIALALSPLHEEPAVLAELLPGSLLRSIDLLRQRADGRLVLQREVCLHLMGAPCPEQLPTGSAGRESLMPGLYHLVGLPPRQPTQLLAQTILRLDALRDPKPVATLTRLLRRAQLQDAAVLVEGLPGLSYPAFHSDGTLPQLRALLALPRVPVLLCAMQDGPAAMGLSARSLPSPANQGLSDLPAPILPSAQLPTGTSWRTPLLPAQAVFLDQNHQHGRLEHLTSNDRRAAILVGPSATPEAYAAAAYLAARDGAVMILDAELTTARATVLSLLLRQLPVVIAATPPAGPGTPWPPSLVPFVVHQRV